MEHQPSPSVHFERFRNLVRNHIGATLAEYRFEEHDAQLLYPGMGVNYRNAATHVEVYYEYGTGVLVSFHPLVRLGNTVVVDKGYGLEELLSARAPQSARYAKIVDFDEQAIAAALATHAVLMKQYADDVLRGDFGVFSLLSQMRAERERYYPTDEL